MRKRQYENSVDFIPMTLNLTSINVYSNSQPPKPSSLESLVIDASVLDLARAEQNFSNPNQIC